MDGLSKPRYAVDVFGQRVGIVFHKQFKAVVDRAQPAVEVFQQRIHGQVSSLQAIMAYGDKGILSDQWLRFRAARAEVRSGAAVLQLHGGLARPTIAFLSRVTSFFDV